MSLSERLAAVNALYSGLDDLILDALNKRISKVVAQRTIRSAVEKIVSAEIALDRTKRLEMSR